MRRVVLVLGLLVAVGGAAFLVRADPARGTPLVTLGASLVVVSRAIAPPPPRP